MEQRAMIDQLIGRGVSLDLSKSRPSSSSGEWVGEVRAIMISTMTGRRHMVDDIAHSGGAGPWNWKLKDSFLIRLVRELDGTRHLSTEEPCCCR